MMLRKLWIVSGVAVVVVVNALLVYGSYISARYQMEALRSVVHGQWVQLDGSIRRWADVAPQFAAAAGPVEKQDAVVLDAINSARQTILRERTPEAVIPASRGLDEALKGVRAVAHSNAKLRGDAKFQALEERLARMRVRVAQDRERYNASLRNYNVFISEFPNNIWAKIAGFAPDRWFFPKIAGES
jgi:LemA protein